MHTLTFIRPDSGEKVRLRCVPTATAIALVANRVAEFNDPQVQEKVEHLIESIAGGEEE
jgi:hypothetical protein